MRHSKKARLLGVVSAVATLSVVGLTAPALPATAASMPSSISVWSYYSTPGQLAFEKTAAAAFNAKFPGVKVQYLNIPFNSLDPKLLAAASVHSGPDVVVDNPVVDFPELSQAGALADMTPYMNQLGATSPFPSGVLWKAGGKIETIQSYVNIVALFYNKSILNTLHLSVPTTVSQLAAELPVVVKAGYTGLLMDGDTAVDGGWQLFPWLSNHGVTFCSLRSASTVPTVASVLNQLRTWESNGWIPKDFSTLTQTTTLPTFLAGKAAFMENGNWNISSLRQEVKFPIGVVAMPAATQPSHVLLGGEGEAVGGYSPNKQAAWDYLQYGWFSQQAGKALLADTGSLVTRSDLGGYVSKFPLEGAFLNEVKNGLGSWPDNKAVDKVATDFGNVWSGFAGGSGTPQSTAQSIRSTITSDLVAGGGGC
jgi:arabinogalactan oligomer/maltooligosaccharide transport system substrate-binding protein